MSEDQDDGLPSDCDDDEVMASMRHVPGRDAQLALRAEARDMLEVFTSPYGTSSTRLSNEWLGTHGWRVQLLRQRALASPETLEIFDPLVAILRRRGVPALLGTSVGVESFETPTAVWRVTLDSDSISRFFFAHRFGFHLLFPEDRSFAIHGWEDVYAAFAGPEGFLHEALRPELQGATVTADLKRYMEHDFGEGAFDPSLAHYDPFLLEG